MPAPDYSFMRTGLGGGFQRDPSWSEDDWRMVKAALLVFTEEALVLAARYAHIRGREAILPADLIACLKVQTQRGVRGVLQAHQADERLKEYDSMLREDEEEDEESSDEEEEVLGVFDSTRRPESTNAKTENLVDTCTSVFSNKKIAYLNKWDRPRNFSLRTSEPSVVKAKDPRLQISARGKGFIRLWFAPVQHAGTQDMFIFVNDEEDQNEECLMLRVRYS